MRPRNDPDGLAGRKLYIGGLLEDVRKEELTKELARFGPLDDVWIARNPPGFAFVVYQRDADAERCARALDGMNVCGSRIRVEFAHRLHKDAPPSGKFGGGSGGRSRGEPAFERSSRGGAYERGPASRSSGSYERPSRGSYSDRPGYSGRSHEDRPGRSFNSDKLDRNSGRPRYDPPRRGDYRRRYSPAGEYDADAGSDDLGPLARLRNDSYRSRSPGSRVRPFSDADDFEPRLRRGPPPNDSYDEPDYDAERGPRRRSPYSPPTNSHRFGGQVDAGHRRDESYSRGGPQSLRADRDRDRDRSPIALRRRPTDEYAGYYGNQTPPLADHDERAMPSDEDEYLPYNAPSPVRLGRPR